MTSFRRVATALSFAVVAAACGGGGGGVDAAAEAGQAYLSAWAEGDAAAMGELATGDTASLAAVVRQQREELRISEMTVTPGLAETDGSTAVLPYTAELSLQGVGEWSYDGSLDLVREDGEWLVAWAPTAVHPQLDAGERFQRVRSQGTRAQIRAQAGQPIASGGGEQPRLVDLAGPTVGTLEPATAADLQELGTAYEVGDMVGASGLEAGLEPRLAGGPTGRLEIVDTGGAVTDVLHEFGSEPPPAVTTTLDFAVQRAAENAVQGASAPVALVVIDSTTGAVRGVANNPTGFDRAFLGEYPPGSTFKVVTAAAMFRDGVMADDLLGCPVETRPGDSRPFRNAFGKDLGTVTFEVAFVESCNTTFVDEGFRLGADVLLEEAERFGFNQDYDVGMGAVRGSFPLPETDTEIAAASIGQGRISSSPLHMASVAAASRDGNWRPPHLVSDLADPEAVVDLGPTVEPLPDFMREVVRIGTGTNAQVPGRDVGGKTGTAEFGSEDPPETHAWFIGFVGPLAFAVVVEGGGVGGTAAAPIAASFIAGLPPQIGQVDAPPDGSGSGGGADGTDADSVPTTSAG